VDTSPADTDEDLDPNEEPAVEVAHVIDPSTLETQLPDHDFCADAPIVPGVTVGKEILENSSGGSTTMGPPKHAPENRRQALKDRKPLLPDTALNPLDADLEKQLEYLIDTVDALNATEDVVAMQAKVRKAAREGLADEEPPCKKPKAKAKAKGKAKAGKAAAEKKKEQGARDREGSKESTGEGDTESSKEPAAGSGGADVVNTDPAAGSGGADVVDPDSAARSGGADVVDPDLESAAGSGGADPNNKPEATTGEGDVEGSKELVPSGAAKPNKKSAEELQYQWDLEVIIL
ncbi:unnamed protein product, partial [Symbiodinium sp. CCMP2456]